MSGDVHAEVADADRANGEPDATRSTTDRQREHTAPEPAGRSTSNSPIVEGEDGREVDVEEWDPMPDDLKRADRVDPTELSDPMEGPAPTG